MGIEQIKKIRIFEYDLLIDTTTASKIVVDQNDFEKHFINDKEIFNWKFYNAWVQLKKNFKGNWQMNFENHCYVFYFESAQDAVIFKMKYG